MNKDTSVEKRYKSMRYVDCYCNKHATVQVGMRLWPTIHILGMLGLAVYSILFLLSGIPVFAKVIILIVLGLIYLLPRSFYRYGKRMMLSAGHTEECGKKIGFLVALYGGGYSTPKIMKSNKEKN